MKLTMKRFLTISILFLTATMTMSAAKLTINRIDPTDWFVGMKNPTSGDMSVMMNSITAAQSSQKFIYRGWEVQTEGNPLAHCILRGYVDKFGRSHPNYHYEDLENVLEAYQKDPSLKNPTIIVDTNHSNLGRFRIGIERTVQAILKFLRTLLCGNVKSVLMSNTMHWAFDVRQVDLVR